MADKITEKTPVTTKEERRVSRWDPFAQLREMQEEMDRLWNNFWSVSVRPPMMPTARPSAMEAIWSPRMDVYKANGNLVIKTELPGMKPEDVSVTLEDGDLIIQGERKAEKEVKEGNYYRLERNYGSFYRCEALPEGITPEQIKATFTNGILEITIQMPSAPKTEARKISIATK